MTFREQAPMWAAFAARALGWRPDEFWRATPSELVGALSDPLGEQVQAPPSRDLITQLMERDAHG